MIDFTLDGLDESITLPDDYPDVEQYERFYRYCIDNEIDNIDVRDLTTLRGLSCAMLGIPVDTLSRLKMTPHNHDTLLTMYNHAATLVAKAMGTTGEPVVDEKIKKGAGGSGSKQKTRKRRQKNVPPRSESS